MAGVGHLEWGHSRLVCEEYLEYYEDEDHMNYVGEFYFKVTETCLHGDHNKRICKDAFSVAGAVQETCSSEMLGGQGADFLRRVAFWSIRSSVLGR